MHTVYSVWVEGAGDIFKGYNNKFISTHLNKRVANRVAELNYGWVEEEQDNLHPDYISQLQENDKNLFEAQNKISQAAKNMLTYGG